MSVRPLAWFGRVFGAPQTPLTLRMPAAPASAPTSAPASAPASAPDETALRPVPAHAPVTLNLALQGGGAHGAFTWGVLDALLDDPGIAVEGLSGSSAGAMNAVVFAEGWRKGGRAGARQALKDFWLAVSSQMPWAAMTRGEGDSIDLAPPSRWIADWAARFSPSQLNPLDLNPLRELLLKQVDFDRLREASPFKLFIGATNVRTGRLRVFREHELSVDVLLASACLPRLHHAIEIDGEPYWDGGYSANPAVFPLFYECEAHDILLVLLAPLEREGVPRSVEEIEARVAELAFSATFMREMRMFARAAGFTGTSLLASLAFGRLERRLRKLRFHMIDSSGVGSLRRTRTQLIAHKPFLELLHRQGRECGLDWCAAHIGQVGKRSTFDVAERFA